MSLSYEQASQRIIVALDCGMNEAIALADKLQGHATWLKVGMTLFYAEGPRAVQEFKQRGFKVFLDLKLHDIPHQIEGAAKAAILTGADMLTVHSSGGEAMMRSAIKGVNAALQQMPQASESQSESPIVLAVTVLTSMDDDTLESVGVECLAATQVERLAKLAKSSGVTGVVASPREAKMLKEVLGEQMYIVTPGVRPAGADAGDQARVTTPAQAFANGSTHVVIGRPITQAADPVEAFDAIAREISGC